MIDFYNENFALKPAGLAIHGASSPIVKTANAFWFKQNGVYSAPVAAADWVGLATALGEGSLPVGNLATGFSRVYTFLISVDTGTGTVTKSIVAGNDFATRLATIDDVNTGNPEDQDGKKVVVGTLLVGNASGADFIPGTTDLDATSITTQYTDAFIAAGV